MLIWKRLPRAQTQHMSEGTANLRTKIIDFRGFDSSIIIISRAGFLMSIVNFLEVLSQRILAGVILVGRLGVPSMTIVASDLGGSVKLRRVSRHATPSPPIKSFPIKSPWVKLSGRPPIKFYGHENFHPWELRVCLSQTLRNPNS